MDGAGRLRDEGARRDRGHALGAAPGQEPHPRHGREPARLVHLAPARLGRADRGVRAQGDRRGAARSRGGRADRRGVRGGGTDAWYTTDPAQFLGPERDPADFEQVMDIVDVWFESGSTHATVLEQRPDLRWPATLYLEGSDQHRGWFHSSLLESCGTRGRAPYDAVLTHGFVVDAEGRKMSKSQGNVISPHGSDEDHGRRHPAVVDGLRRLCGGRPDRRRDPGRAGGCLSPVAQHAALSARQPRRLPRGGAAAVRADAGARALGAASPGRARPLWCARPTRRSTIPRLYSALHNFCATDLSAFYFDVRKDSLYCDRPDSIRRRAARTVLDQLFACLTAWLAPVLVFTAEEAWLARFPSEDDSVHLRLFPEIPAAWHDPALGARWERIRRVRRVVTGALEVERREKRIGSSLEAAPQVFVSGDDARAARGRRPRRAGDHQRHRGAGGARAGRRLHAGRSARGRRACRRGPRARSARAAGRSCRRSARIPRRPSCAAAAAMRSRPGRPPERAPVARCSIWAW